MILKSIIPSNLWTSIQAYINTAISLVLPSQAGNAGSYLTTNGTNLLWVDFFNENNTATGSTSVTINAESGVAVFTSTIATNDFSQFIVNNGTVREGDYFLWSIKYNENASGLPLQSYYSVVDGAVTFFVYNASSVSTDSNISISFKKLT